MNDAHSVQLRLRRLYCCNERLIKHLLWHDDEHSYQVLGVDDKVML